MNLSIRPSQSSRGMTLLELTVVILVLLSLISILFIGARAWMRASDRSGCILNIRNAQNAVRAYQNTRAVPEGTAIDMLTDIIGTGKFMEINPECPANGNYQYIDHVPYPGELAIGCDLAGSEAHFPNDSTDW